MLRAAVATALFVALCFLAAGVGLPSDWAWEIALGAVFLGNLAADDSIEATKAVCSRAWWAFFAGLVMAGIIDLAAD